LSPFFLGAEAVLVALEVGLFWAEDSAAAHMVVPAEDFPAVAAVSEAVVLQETGDERTIVRDKGPEYETNAG
jgi:hypothetical protein